MKARPISFSDLLANTSEALEKPRQLAEWIVAKQRGAANALEAIDNDRDLSEHGKLTKRAAVAKEQAQGLARWIDSELAPARATIKATLDRALRVAEDNAERSREIRHLFVLAAPEERSKFFDAAVSGGDVEVLAAIAGAPRGVFPLPGEAIDRAQLAFLEATSPGLAESTTEMDSAIGAVEGYVDAVRQELAAAESGRRLSPTAKIKAGFATGGPSGGGDPNGPGFDGGDSPTAKMARGFRQDAEKVRAAEA